MAHPQNAEASPAPASTGDRVEDFANYLDGVDANPADEADEDEEEELPEGEQPDDEQDEGDEPESETDENDEGEPEKPVIDPPVSWDKDAKALFAQLPPELQEKVSAREAQREKAVQQATSAAAEAKRNAVVEANGLFADQQRQYASHLEQIASQNMPQRPDPQLLQADPVTFYQLQAHYEAGVAQHQELMQRAAVAKDEAARRDAFNRDQAIAQNQQVLSEKLGDDWTDIGKRQALLTGLEKVGAELGYPADLMGQADATDILALRQAAEWKAKAEKYDQLNKSKMTAVRAAKALPKVAQPNTAPSRADRGRRSADAAWQRAKQTRSGEDYAAVLENMGIKL